MTKTIRSIAVLCAVAGLAACGEKPQDNAWSDYARQQAASRAAAPPPATRSAGTPSGGDESCKDASETPDGRMRCVLSDGRRFDGQVRGGEANGPGQMWFPNGDRYSGTFAGGLFGGSGTYWYASGARYDGQFANGVRHGTGTTVWPSGASYSGNYRDNKPNGYGTVTRASGTRRGEWRNGCLDDGRIAIDSTLAECGYE